MGDQNAGFTGKELHNDLTIALEAKPCLKVKLEFRFKGTSKFVLDEVTPMLGGASTLHVFLRPSACFRQLKSKDVPHETRFDHVR